MICLFLLHLVGRSPVVVPGPVCAAPSDFSVSDEAYFPPECAQKTAVSSDFLFATNSYQLKPSAASVLSGFYDRIMSDVLVYYIDGHADAVGSELYNFDLSVRRASAVRDALIARGVPPERLLARGFGETKPIASNAHSSGRSRNRRVELNPSI